MENAKSWLMGDLRLSNRELLERLLSMKNGITLLNGPTNCGETRLLLQLK